MLLMWGALLGACVAFARDAHLGLDFFVKKLNPEPRRAVATYVHLVTGLFGGILAWGGFKVVERTLSTNQVSAALGVKMGYIYLALPITGLFILILSLERTVESLRGSGANR